MIEPRAEELERAARARFDATGAASETFFAENAARLADACLALARRFHRGGRLFAFGAGASATDAEHVAVEFVHPVLAGKRALPAVALPAGAGGAGLLARRLALLAGPEDIALGLSAGGPGREVTEGLAAARRRGLLTIHLAAGEDPAPDPVPEFAFRVRSGDPMVVQEVQETAYHVLWELVHVFFGHRRLLEDDAAAGGPEAAGEPSPAAFLYPFLEESAGARDPDEAERVLAGVRASTGMKCREIAALREETLSRNAGHLEAAARRIGAALAAGGRLFAFGNGGSATDAADLAADLMEPPLPGGRAWPALALSSDAAAITAVGNDVGFENVFVRQLLAFGRPGDVAVGFSTSGSSRNVLAAFETARRLGMVTVALAGGDGGRCAALAREGALDGLLVAPSDHVPRVQEAQATLYHTLWALLQRLPETRPR